MDNFFGAKDLYDVTLRATYPVEINGRTYSEGEVLCRFSNIQIARISERKIDIAAHGGKGDTDWVFWNDTDSVSFNFAQGVFSKQQLGFFWNGNIESLSQRIVSMHEVLDSDLGTTIELKYVPVGAPFVYNSSGQKITNYTIENKTISLPAPMQEVEIDYCTMIDGVTSVLSIGNPLITGFLQLEGKMRLKDDKTGKIVTGIFTIPKFKLKTGLSIQVGQGSSPMVANFQGEGQPTVWQGRKTAMDLYILPYDIDSDL